MNLKNRKFFWLGVILVLLFMASPLRVGAVEDDCQFTEEATELEKIKDNPELSYIQKTKAEFELRKAIIKKVVSCGITESKTLKSELSKIKSDDKDILRLKERFLLELDQAINYYLINGAGLNDINLLGMKNLAKKFLDWRLNNYRYTAGGAINLITWVNNQNLFRAAEHRSEQANSILVVLRGRGEEGEINKILRAAEANLLAAKGYNEEAKLILKGYSPPENALELIKSSLTSLALVYENFFRLSETITSPPDKTEEEVNKNTVP